MTSPSIDPSVRERLRESLLVVTALKESMEQAVRSDANNMWKHSAYKQYMQKYNEIVVHIRSFAEIAAPISVFDLDNVPGWGDTVWPMQKMYFDSVHANLAILEAYLVAKLDLQAERATTLRHFLEANLRKAVFDSPMHEREIQNAVEQLLIGRGLTKGIDYDREVGRVKFSIKEVVPDFILPKLSLAVEVKLAKTDAKAKTIVDEINADIRSYGKGYKQVLFVVYDLGTIRDTLEFVRDLEATEGVEVIVVKH